MKFRKYEKIYRIGKDEVDGILNGYCYITEKIDGANLSIWRGDGGEIRVGSRNNDVTDGEFNGAVEYAQTHEGIKKYLEEHPTHRLYGEWLVRHTLLYKETAYKKFYLFDIYDEEAGVFLLPSSVSNVANEYEIISVPVIGEFINPSIEDLNKLIDGTSALGDRMEGIVIKNLEFVNNFGDYCWAKLVRQDFKEDNAICFGGNNKHSDTYWEVYIINKYITLARVDKIINKIQPTINEKLDLKHIPRVLSTVYHDMITEEAWDISQKVESISFKDLQRLSYKKIKQIYVDILNDSISVADAETTN